jgi:transcriptional regulator with XRE-family HTH domain
MATIAENIKRWRTKRGLTQDSLGKKAIIRCSTLTKIEGGIAKEPGVLIVAIIAKGLGVSIEELIK